MRLLPTPSVVGASAAGAYAAVLSVALLGAAVPTAQAEPIGAGRDCVTRAEFRAVSDGTTKRRVHATFGTRGAFGDGGAGGYSRLYRQCGLPGPGEDACRVVVEYAAGPEQRARVADKTFDGRCR